jgi:predicted Fe-S protein YdhL (DUF1289 family)
MSRPTRPMSPCLSICTLDEDSVCMGCLRTLNEIKGWVFLQPAAQWSLVEELAERRAAQDVQQNKQKSP